MTLFKGANSQLGALLVKNNLSDLDSASTARTNLGLGSAATHAAGDFDSAGAASSAQTAAQAYTDMVAVGLSVKPTARFATTAALPTYTISGGGSTMTMNATGALAAQDGVTAQLNDLFFYDQDAQHGGVDNGLWKITTLGAVGVAMVAQRITQLAVGASANGAITRISEGTTRQGEEPLCVTDKGSDVVGTNVLTWIDTSIFSERSSVTPQAVGTTGAAGSSLKMSRGDHAHAHGSQTDPVLHAVAVASGNAGFLSGTDKAKIDALGTAATHASTDFDASGAAAAAQAASLQIASNLSDLASASSARSNLGIGVMFGDGATGAVHYTTNTTLAADVRATTVLIDSGVTVTTAGFEIAATTSITNNGTISAKGGDASGSTAGNGAAGLNSTAGVGAGTGGGRTAAGGVCITNSGSFLTAEALGAAGGAGGSGVAGGTNGTFTVDTNITSPFIGPNPTWVFGYYIDPVSLNSYVITCGAGGGGGNVTTGGAGGGGAGIIRLRTPFITNNGTITAAGGNGSAGTASGGSGGGGGGGGRVITVGTYSGTSPVVTGGSGGAGNGAGSAGSSGSNGTWHRYG